MAAAVQAPNPIKRKPLTIERLRSLLSYDPATGCFKWLVNKGRIKAGQIAGYLRPDGYIVIGIDQETYLAHLLAWFYVHGWWPTEELDHRDTDRSNNIFTNLREATSGQNSANARRHKDNSSGFKGVTFHTMAKRWKAQLFRNGRHIYLGYFDTREEAHAAYVEAAQKVSGEYARAA